MSRARAGAAALRRETGAAAVEYAGVLLVGLLFVGLFRIGLPGEVAKWAGRWSPSSTPATRVAGRPAPPRAPPGTAKGTSGNAPRAPSATVKGPAAPRRARAATGRARAATGRGRAAHAQGTRGTRQGHERQRPGHQRQRPRHQRQRPGTSSNGRAPAATAKAPAATVRAPAATAKAPAATAAGAGRERPGHVATVRGQRQRLRARAGTAGAFRARGARRRPLLDRPGRAQRDRGEGPGARTQRRQEGRHQARQLRRRQRRARRSTQKLVNKLNKAVDQLRAEPQDHGEPVDQGDLADPQVRQPALQGPPTALQPALEGPPGLKNKKPPEVPTGARVRRRPSSRAAGAANKILRGMGKFGKGLGIVGTAISGYDNIRKDGSAKGATETLGGAAFDVWRGRRRHGCLRRRSASPPPVSADSCAPACAIVGGYFVGKYGKQITGWARPRRRGLEFHQGQGIRGREGRRPHRRRGRQEVLGGANKVISSLKPGFL